MLSCSDPDGISKGTDRTRKGKQVCAHLLLHESSSVPSPHIRVSFYFHVIIYGALISQIVLSLPLYLNFIDFSKST